MARSADKEIVQVLPLSASPKNTRRSLVQRADTIQVFFSYSCILKNGIIGGFGACCCHQCDLVVTPGLGFHTCPLCGNLFGIPQDYLNFPFPYHPPSEAADNRPARTIGRLPPGRHFTLVDFLDDPSDNFADQVLESRSYKLTHTWFAVVNRLQSDINRKVDITALRRKERAFFQTSADYSHLANRMGTEYLVKVCSKATIHPV
eukprot:TRINITY_DN733_c0_g1_i2.p1 TRINITY_DN733_c0_g1~~TRINITY_DN733_c0_g1_i2.p1  ORF type:complete len:204 (-),score=1.64 TRINITY_DN733_c0_g1_i2:594-1205(-)